MNSKVAAQQLFSVGEPLVIKGRAPSGHFSAVFEDDGETGYFYAVGKQDAILDAVHIYNVESITDRNKPSELKILWSSSCLQVALLINQQPHAAFDFQQKIGYNRGAFPPPAPGSEWTRQDWRSELRGLFYS